LYFFNAKVGVLNVQRCKNSPLAIKIVFPEGIKIRTKVGQVDNCLKKRLHSINNLYIYGLRFSNLKKFNIDEKEILMKKKY